MQLDSTLSRVMQATVADKSAPAELRGSCTDWLHRHQTGLDLHRQLSEAGRAAAEQLQEAKRDAPRQLELMLAAGQVTTDAIGARLPDLRWQLDIAQDRHAIARQAVNSISSQIRTAPWRSCADSILPWCAASLQQLENGQQLPEHLEYAWRQSAGRWRVLWPFESCELPPLLLGQTPGTVTMLPLRSRLELPYSTTRAEAPRHRWLWQHIAAGDYQAKPISDGHQLELTSTAPWR